MAKATVSVKVMAAIKGNSVSDGQWQQVMATTTATATDGLEMEAVFDDGGRNGGGNG